MRHLPICVLCFCFSVSLLPAQSGSFKIEQLPPGLGLSHGTITTILQDRQGFMWFGTWWGLARYDGYSVKFFKQSPTAEGLQSNKISALLEDRQGRIWVATVNAGVFLFDRTKETFTAFQHRPDDPQSLCNNNVWALCEDRAGQIWIGTEKGLDRLDPATGKLSPVDSGPASALEQRFVYSLNTTDDGSLWVGTTSGLYRLSPGSAGWQARLCETIPADQAPAENAPARFIYQIKAARREPNTLWICTKGGLLKALYTPGEPAGWQVVRRYVARPGDPAALSHNYVTDVLEPQRGEGLWLSTFHGLDYLELASDRFRSFFAEDAGPAINNNLVVSLWEDQTGIVWIGTEKGVNKINAGKAPFNSILLDPNKNATRNVVAALAPGQNRPGVWIGSRGGGLCFWPGPDAAGLPAKMRPVEFPTRFVAPTKDFISGLLLDRQGQLWISTHGAGVLRAREKDLPVNGGPVSKFEQFTAGTGSHSINDNYVMSVFESSDGGVWLGMWDAGLCRFDPATNVFTPYHRIAAQGINLDAFPNVHFLETRENGRSALWIATRGGGLLKTWYDAGQGGLVLLQRFNHEADAAGSLSSNVVNSLLVDSQGRLWVGTEAGLDLLLPGTTEFRHFNGPEEMADGVVQGIVESANGQLWISTQTGLSCLVLTERGAEINHFTGAGDLEGNYFYEPAACRLPSGQLLFGGVNGLTLFDPQTIHKNRRPPAVVLTDFRLFNQSVPVGTEKYGRIILPGSIGSLPAITLEYAENVVSFEFAALQFDQPEKNLFSYRLAGFHQNWTTTTADQRLAHYTNLPPGHYVFQVKASNADGVWNEVPATIALHVLPPWYRSHWAYALYTLLGIALLWAARRVAMMRFEFKQRLAVERLEREKVEEVSRIKTQFFTNISHELRTPLTLILTPLEQLIKEYNGKKNQQIYTVMHHNAARLHTMINQLLDIRKGEEGVLRLHAAEADLVEFLREIFLSFRSWADQRRIAMSFGPTPEKVLVWFDKEQMEKVFYNLLSNALKYTPAGGSVQLSIAGDERQVTVYTADNGPGIPAGETQRIFERFHQVETPETDHQAGGAGIGLALVKMMVERHGGRVEVDSQEGIGSCFAVILPLGKQHLKAEDLHSPPVHRETSAVPALAPGLSGSAAAGDLLAEGQKGAHRKARLLIVEDNEAISLYLQQNLSGEFRVETAAQGVEGLEKALAYPPDLIISDIAMPEMDGIELCRLLKSNIVTSHVPVILLTARSSLIFQIDGLETGADDYITKPFNLQLLTIRIRNLIRVREQLREKFSRSLDVNPAELAVNSLDETFLQNIIASIERRLEDSDYSVDQLAQDVFMSRIQVYRKIKALTGEAPNVFIRQVRLKKAAALLATRQFTVAEVTYKVGYTDLKHFREQFRKLFGVSPSEY